MLKGRTPMTRRLQAFLRAGSWLVLAASFTCLPIRSAPAEDIKIGVLEPFTGPWAKNGNESYVAMEIAPDMIHEKEASGARKSLSSVVARQIRGRGKVRPSGSSARTASS